MTDSQDREIASLIAIPACDRTPDQAERLELLQSLWEAEQNGYYAYRAQLGAAGAGVARYACR